MSLVRNNKGEEVMVVRIAFERRRNLIAENQVNPSDKDRRVRKLCQALLRCSLILSVAYEITDKLSKKYHYPIQVSICMVDHIFYSCKL